MVPATPSVTAPPRPVTAPHSPQETTGAHRSPTGAYRKPQEPTGAYRDPPAPSLSNPLPHEKKITSAKVRVLNFRGDPGGTIAPQQPPGAYSPGMARLRRVRVSSRGSAAVLDEAPGRLLRGSFFSLNGRTLADCHWCWMRLLGGSWQAPSFR